MCGSGALLVIVGTAAEDGAAGLAARAVEPAGPLAVTATYTTSSLEQCQQIFRNRVIYINSPPVNISGAVLRPQDRTF